MADIVLVNPAFDVSFWGMEHAMPFFGKKANLPVACLPLLAAPTPTATASPSSTRMSSRSISTVSPPPTSSG